MTSDRQLIFATTNQGKLREIREMLGASYEVKSLTDLDPSIDIPETGSTLEENSAIKARYVADRFGVKAFADDSGLEVKALDGAPGVHSARYAGPENDSNRNMDLLLARLSDKDRSARFRTVITYIDGAVEKQFEGTIDGTITHERIGSGGFGYDPVFIPSGHDRTFAQMTAEEKNTISHRGQAMEKFVRFLLN